MANKKRKDSLNKILDEKFGNLNALYAEQGLKPPSVRDERTGKPYWASQEENGGNGPAQANPDLIDEVDGRLTRPISEEEESKLESIRETFGLLTEKQKRVVYLCGYEGYSLERAAQLMGMKKDAVRSLLEKARKNIGKLHDEKNKQK